MEYAVYNSYKETDIVWLNSIPEHWELASFNRILFGIKDGTHGTHPRVPDGFPLLSAKNVKDSSLDIGITESTISQVEHNAIIANGYPARGDVLVTCVGSIGRSYVYDLDYPIAFQRSVAFLRLEKSFHPQYCKYFIESSGYQQYLNSVAKVSAQSGVYMGDIAKSPILVLPILEQQKIAAFLDYKTQQIDQLIAKKRALIEKLEEKRIAVITKAVTKGLDENVTLKPSGVDWLGDVPEHWEVMQFKDRCRVVSGQVNPTEVEFENLPLIAPDHIEKNSGRIIDMISAKEQGAISGKYLFKKGDILYSKIRPELNKLCIAPELGLCSADMYAIRTEPDLLSVFLFYTMLSKYYFQYAILESMRVAMPKINREALGAFKILVPPIDEQRQLINYVTNELNKIETSINISKRSIITLQEYRSALITAAVTGKIDVRDIEIPQGAA